MLKIVEPSKASKTSGKLKTAGKTSKASKIQKPIADTEDMCIVYSTLHKIKNPKWSQKSWQGLESSHLIENDYNKETRVEWQEKRENNN